MGLPYIPGFGDWAATELPKLGQNIAAIARPNLQYEQAIKEMALTNPQMLDQLTLLEQSTPGAIERLFGKNAAGFVGGRELTQPTQQKLESQRLGVEQQKQDITKSTEDIKAAQLQNEINTKFWNVFTKTIEIDPSRAQRLLTLGAQKRFTGMTDLEVAAAENELEAAQDVRQADELWKSYATGKDINTMYKEIRSGTAKPEIVGAAFSAPTAQSFREFWKLENARELEMLQNSLRIQLAGTEDALGFKRLQRQAEADVNRLINQNRMLLTTMTIGGKNKRMLNAEQLAPLMKQYEENEQQVQTIVGQFQLPARTPSTIEYKPKQGLMGKAKIIVNGEDISAIDTGKEVTTSVGKQVEAALKAGKSPNGKPFTIADIDAVTGLTEAEKQVLRTRYKAKK